MNINSQSEIYDLLSEIFDQNNRLLSKEPNFPKSINMQEWSISDIYPTFLPYDHYPTDQLNSLRKCIDKIRLGIFKTDSNFIEICINSLNSHNNVIEEMSKVGYKNEDEVRNKIIGYVLEIRGLFEELNIESHQDEAIMVIPQKIGSKDRIAILNELGIIQLLIDRYDKVGYGANPNRIAQTLESLGVGNKTTLQPYVRDIFEMSKEHFDSTKTDLKNFNPYKEPVKSNLTNNLKVLGLL